MKTHMYKQEIVEASWQFKLGEGETLSHDHMKTAALLQIAETLEAMRLQMWDLSYFIQQPGVQTAIREVAHQINVKRRRRLAIERQAKKRTKAPGQKS